MVAGEDEVVGVPLEELMSFDGGSGEHEVQRKE